MNKNVFGVSHWVCVKLARALQKNSDWTFHILSCNYTLNLSSHVVVSHDGVRTGVVGVLVIRINTCADNLWTENLKSIPTKSEKIHQSLEETKVSKNSSAGYKEIQR